MYCPKCGAQIADDSRFCPQCGNSTVAQTPQAPQAPPQQPAYQQPQPVYQQPAYQEHTSGMAVAALVTGIVGFFLSPLSVLAIIFGAVGISQCGKDPYLKGKGMAVAGLVLGIINIALWVILWVWIGLSFWWLF
jgi:hypothetical protein